MRSFGLTMFVGVFLCGLPKSLPNACEKSCNEPLGVESKRIKDQQITASSAFNDDFVTYGSQRARLNLTSWPPGYRANPTELSFTWIKVDLGTDKVITGLATQGYGDTSVTEWVTSYIAMYESRMGDMQQFTNMQGGPQIFSGNRDSSSIRRQDIPIPVVTSVITFLPQAWTDNVGLRLEIYGCDPGYYFVVWRMLDNQLFTPNHANSKRSEEYTATREETLAEIEDYLGLFPGFLSVEFVTFSAQRSAFGGPVLTAEMKIFCLKSSEKNLAAKLNTEIKYHNAVSRFPLTCECSYPQVNISLSKTLDEATVLFTTQNIMIQAETKRGNCDKSLYFQWEIAKASDQSSEFGGFVAHGDAFKNISGVLELNGRELGECYLYIRCNAFNTGPSGQELKTYDYGFVRVLYPPLIAHITGSITAIKGNGSVILNASSSYDPHTLVRNSRELTFTWYCRRLDNNITKEGSSGCYGHTDSGKLTSNGSILVVDVDKMDANQTYLFELLIAKDRRVSRSFHALTVIPPFVISLRCAINCGRKVSANKRMIIETTCRGPYCLDDISYSWALYQTEFNASANGPQWMDVPNLQSYILTDVDSPNMVFSGSRKPLQPSTEYKVVASVLLRDGIIERGEMVFVTNAPPYDPYGESGCSVYPTKGRVLQTEFNVTCFGWEDEDLPLTYQLSYRSSEGLIIIASGNTSSFITMLPKGNQSNNYEVKLEAQIFDSLGDASTVHLAVQVEPLSKAEATKAVRKAIYGPNSRTAKLLRSGNLQKAILTSYFTLTATEGTGISAVEINGAKDEVLKHLVVARPQKIQEVTQLSATVIKTTQRRNNMTVSSVGNAATMLESMTNYLSTEASNSGDIDMVQQVGSGLLNGMSNVLDVSTKSELSDTKHDERHDSEQQPRKFNAKSNKENSRMIEKSVSLMDKLGTALLSTKVVGESEPSVFETNVLSMVLDRQTPSTLVKKRLQWDDGGSGVSFPSQETLIQTIPFPVHSLDSQMLTFKSNPFSWDTSSKNITSVVVDVSIKANGSSLHLTDLEEPFELYIPLKHQHYEQETNSNYFVKWSNSFENIRYHKIIIPSDRVVAIIEIVPVEDNILDIFISGGVRPTPDNYSYSTYVPNYTKCKNLTSSTGHQPCNNSISPYRFYISSNLTGTIGDHFVGILFHNNSSNEHNNSSSNELTMNDASNKHHRRHSRSACSSKSGRKKRSCIGVKDPPTTPPPTPEIIKPVYNSTVDANYTMSVSIASCLYWSKQEQQWTNEGCKVGPQTNPSKLHCLCNHLTAFGGDFFVTPNPIDFDKVWIGFGRLGETGHFVFAVVVCIYGVYLLSLLLARYFDKKDKDKVVANVVMNGPDQEGHIYEIQIQTGIWKGFGTTANVGINIFGEDGSSGPIILTDLSLYGKLFSRGSVNNFVIFLPRSLGTLVKLCIWHDNFGQSPSWFLRQVLITESHAGTKWYFFANKWIAVERGSGNLVLELSALEEKERANFKHLFFSQTSRRFGDEHIWISLFTRPPHSPFTRCQRLSCCLSFLFTSMVANAMFYQFSEKPTHTFKLGPLVLSWRQIMIGIQSGLIVIPVNMVIIVIFRNAVKLYAKTVYYPKSNVADKESSCRLPRWLVFVAWILCILVTLASSAFTVFYSLSWGAEISNQWLTSITASLVQDVLFIQPVKVILIAMFVSLVMRTSSGKEDVHGATIYIDSQQKYNAPNEHVISKAKEYGKKLLEMFKAIKDVVALLVFFLLLMVVCYGNRDSQRFLMTTSVKDIFSGFKKVKDVGSFWDWTRHELIPGLYDVTWYNMKPFNYKEGFLSNREAFLIGMPRLRQIRLKQETRCQDDSDIFPVKLGPDRCLLPYSSDSEHKSLFNQPKWIPVKNHTSKIMELYQLCPKPWRYQSPHKLQTLPYKGLHNEYDGGGYVAYLGYNEESAMDVVNKLQTNDWIDEFTVAVFIEFSVHEPSSRLFNFAKYLYERLPTGGVITTVDVHTLALYPPSNESFNTFYEVCHLLFVVCIIILLSLELRELKRQKRAYFTQIWNWVHILQILTSISAGVMVLLKAKQTSSYVRRVQQNPYDNYSPDRIARLSEYENYLLALVIFIVTIRLLKLVKFNAHICQMAGTLRRSGRSLISFGAVFANSLLAFSLAGGLAFGVTIKSFSSFYQSLGTVIQMSIGGKLNFPQVKLQHQILGPLFLSIFVLWMILILVNISVVILVDFYRAERENAASSDLASFMFTYFSSKTNKFLNMKSKLKKRRVRKYSRSHWKRTGHREGVVSQAPTSLDRFAKSQGRIDDLEAESILHLEEFDSFQSDELYAEQVTSSDSLMHCTCNDNKVIHPEICTSTSDSSRSKKGHCSVNTSTNLCCDDEKHSKSPASEHLDLKLGFIEVNDLDIYEVKSNIFDVALELSSMLADFKKTD